MQIELNAEQQRILERAMQDGSTVSEVLDRAFAMIEAQLEGDWSSDLSPEELEAIEAHIEEGCAQADRGELYTPEEVKRMMAERKTRRQVA
ncbi:hypothetical protein [Terracidiphilus sp.]|uniref:hypothetical protein n=1 Tax=Terracidiphilus sp. TaxID=1964191 RepID=UPI003C239859